MNLLIIFILLSAAPNAHELQHNKDNQIKVMALGYHLTSHKLNTQTIFYLINFLFLFQANKFKINLTSHN
jgi:hypothetical protein